jgi:TnpA family transposase
VYRDTDLSTIRQHRGLANRLGFAVQLCCMRYPGMMLAADAEPFAPSLRLVATQLKVPPEAWADYGQREDPSRASARTAIGLWVPAIHHAALSPQRTQAG